MPSARRRCSRPNEFSHALCFVPDRRETSFPRVIATGAPGIMESSAAPSRNAERVRLVGGLFARRWLRGVCARSTGVCVHCGDDSRFYPCFFSRNRSGAFTKAFRGHSSSTRRRAHVLRSLEVPPGALKGGFDRLLVTTLSLAPFWFVMAVGSSGRWVYS